MKIRINHNNVWLLDTLNSIRCWHALCWIKLRTSVGVYSFLGLNLYVAYLFIRIARVGWFDCGRG